MDDQDVTNMDHDQVRPKRMQHTAKRVHPGRRRKKRMSRRRLRLA